MADFYRVQDPKISQKSLLDDYRDKWKNDQSQQAHDLINTLENEEITLKSNKLNPEIDSIKTLEQYWFNEVIDRLETTKNTFQSWIDNLQETRTTWSSTIQYYKNNVVAYNDSMYLCKQQPSIGTLPTNTTYWVGFNLKGNQGFASLGVKMAGTWDAHATYSTLDTVFYGEGEYKGLYTANTNILSNQNSPDQNSNWTFTLHTHITNIDYMTSLGQIHQLDDDIFILGNTTNSNIQYYYMDDVTPVPLDIQSNLSYVNYDPSSLSFLTTTDITATKAIQKIWAYYNLS